MEESDDKPKLLSRIILIILVVIMWIGLTTKPHQKPYNAFRGGYISADVQDSVGSVGSQIRSNSIVSINSPLFIHSEALASLGENIITDEMSRVIECESRGDNSKIGDLDYYVNGKQSPSYGIAQFQKSTWYWMSDLSGIYGDIYNENDQLILMHWAFDNGLQHHWSCWRKLK